MGQAERIKAQALAVAGLSTFPELAALALAKRFVRAGRGKDARRILISYLKQYSPTDAVVAELRALS